MATFELGRVERLTKTYDLAVLFPALTGPFTAATVALLAPRATPTASTTWLTVSVASGVATVTYAGPDADATGAVVVPADVDLWIKATSGVQVDTVKVGRIYLLGGGAPLVAPGPSAVVSVNGKTGSAVVLSAADVGALGATAGAGGALSGSYPNPGLNASSVESIVTGSAAVKAAFRTVGDDRSEALRIVPKMPLHPAPPTVTLGTSNAATGLSGTVVSVDGADTRLRFTGCNGRWKPAAWYWMGVTPNSSTLDAGAPYFVDFMMDSADFEIQLAGQRNGSGYRLWIDGQPVTDATQAGPTATGGGHRLRLTFSTRAARHIRILTDAGFCAVFYGVTDTLFASTRPLYNRRAYFLGDSFSVGANASFGQDGYLYRLAERLGWEPLCGGEAGTGYNATGSGGGRTTFPNRVVSDIVPTAPDLVVIYGGTNDSTSGLQAAAAATYSALATNLPGVPVYVFGVQYPSGAADATRDTKDAAIAAAAAAPNVELFRSVKTWITGTGRVGAAANNGNADVHTSSDGLHPSSAGHEYIAARMAQEIIPIFTA